MRELGIELVGDVLVTALSAAGAVAFTVVGLLIERAGLDALLAGALAQGAWELWMGTLALFVGIYLLGYQTALPGLVGLR